VSGWPWWVGALALGGLAAGYFGILGRTFGVSGAVSRVVDGLVGSPANDAPAPDCGAPVAGVGPTPSFTAWTTFLVAIVVGGALSALLAGGLDPSLVVGPSFEASVGSGLPTVVTLLVGGALVGLGTRMAGGCTSGHGLCGNARLHPGSIVATVTFFGAGVAASFLLELL
jgi:hypothetical protein